MRVNARVLSVFLAACFVSLAPAQTTPPAASQPTAGATPAKKPVERPQIYDEKADAKVQIATALRHAKRDNKRVLIQWGGNWCPWCIRRHELFAADKQIARTLKTEYELVLVDTGQPKAKNVDVAETYQAELKKHGFPYLTVLDADGKLIANQETASLEVKDDKGESKGVKEGHDPAKVLKFLLDHKSPAVAAMPLLDKALAEAKAADKRVFLRFGADWCIWCHRLEDWTDQPKVAQLLGKDFVGVVVDIERFPGGQELFRKYAASVEHGLPWYGIIDADGKLIASSDAPEPVGTIGFPMTDAKLTLFAEMIKKGAKSLNTEEIEALLASMREFRLTFDESHKPAAPAPNHGADAK